MSDRLILTNLNWNPDLSGMRVSLFECHIIAWDRERERYCTENAPKGEEGCKDLHVVVLL